MAKISVHGFHIVLDMSFFGLMKPKECVSLRQQVAYCYSANRKASIPAKTFLTSTSPEALEVLNVMMGFSNWPSFSVHSECYMDLFPKESLVYLTADSQNELEKIDFSKIYIIGAFVDKNRHKGITMLKAKDQGISTAYLPLNKYLDMKGTKVLTVNHVFDILLKIAAGSGNMKKAVEEGVPGRKHSDLKRDMTESFISSKRLCLEECNASNNTEDNATVHVDLDNSEPISNEVFDV